MFFELAIKFRTKGKREEACNVCWSSLVCCEPMHRFFVMLMELLVCHLKIPGLPVFVEIL